jgi:hypothetical protein
MLANVFQHAAGARSCDDCISWHYPPKKWDSDPLLLDHKLECERASGPMMESKLTADISTPWSCPGESQMLQIKAGLPVVQRFATKTKRRQHLARPAGGLARLGRLAWCYDRQYADADKVLFYGARTYCFHDLDLIKIQKIIKCETSTRGA